MANKIWTAAELELMTPDERARVINECIVTDLSTVAPEFLERVRTKGRQLMAERGILNNDHP
jgi:hypothetical protein